MREAEKAAHELWGRPINRKDSREVFETRGSAADDLKRLQRAVDDTSPIGWKRRMRRSWRRRIRIVLFTSLALLIVLFAIVRGAHDTNQQSSANASPSADAPLQSDEPRAPTETDRQKVAKALIDARVAAVNGSACSESGPGALSVHISFDRIGAASRFEVVHSSGDQEYDACKLRSLRSALGQLLYIDGLPYVGDVIYTVNGTMSTLEVAPASAPPTASVPAVAPASASKSGLPPEVEEFIATHIASADCDSRTSCLALYAKTIAAMNASQPASDAP